MARKRIIQRENIAKLKELGTRFNLNFCKYASIGNKLLGLDARSRKLLVADKHQTIDESHIIDLRKVRNVSFVTQYGSIRAGELNKRKLDDFLHFIHLKFEHTHKIDSTRLSFYDRRTDARADIRRLIIRSKLMQMLLSRFVASIKLNPITPVKIGATNQKM